MALKSKESLDKTSRISRACPECARDRHLKLRNFKPVEIGELLAEPRVGDMVETKRVRAVIAKIWPDCLSCESRRGSFRRERLRVRRI